MGTGLPRASSAVERRLTVRAYHHWTGLLGGRACPATEDCDLLGRAEFAPHAIVLKREEGWVVRFAGTRTAPLLAGRSLLRDRIAQACCQVVERRAPAAIDSAEGGAAPAMLYRGILLPFASEEQGVGRIVAIISHKEASPQVRAFSRDVPRSTARQEPLFTWADGPLDGNPPDVLASLLLA